MTRFRLESMLTSILLISGLVTACGQSAGNPAAVTTALPTAAAKTSAPTAAATQRPSTQVTTAPQPAATKEPAAASKPSGILRVAVTTFGADDVDPLAGHTAMLNTVGPMYDELVGANPDGTIGPAVAQRWELSSDGLAWTFYLRKGMQFNDNWGEVTADDVQFSLTRQTSARSKSAWAGTLSEAIKNIDVVDPYTVRVNLKHVFLDLPYQLSSLVAMDGMILPKKYIDQKGDEEFRRHPVGSGPWKLVEHVPGSKYEYVAVTDPEHYKNHYRQMPSFERLQLVMVPEEATRVAMLRAGQVDVVDITAESIDEVQKAGLKVAQISPSYQLNLEFWDSHRPEVAGQPASNLNVRKALSMAINRDEIVRFLLRGYGDASPMPARLFPFSMDIDPDYWKEYAQKNYKYDPTQAKQLLSQAGFDNSPINFYSYAQEGVPIQPKLAETMAGYWSAVGVKTTLVPIEYGAFRGLFSSKPHNPKLYGTASIVQAPVRYQMGSSLQLSFHSQGSNAAMNDPQVDKLIDGVLAEPNNAKRRDLTKQAIQATADSFTIFPIVYQSALYALSNNVDQWQPIPGSGYPLMTTYETTTRRVR